MKSKTLIVLANEKVCEYDKNFYCERHDEKSIPEGLSKYNNTYYLVRNSNKKGNTSDRAVGDKVQGDSLWRTLHKATNMDSENSGLFRKFIDLGLRRFYNDVDDVSRKISGR